MFYKSNDNLIFSSRSVLEKKKKGEKEGEEQKIRKWICPRYMGLDKTIVCFFIACYFSYDAVWSKEDTNHVKMYVIM